MPLGRGQITLGVGGANEVTLECEPFEWPRSAFEVLELRITERTGWYALTDAVRQKLVALYAGAQGSVEAGLKGLIVQYIAGTGGAVFTVTDWRGNTSTSVVFSPGDGLELQEIQGAAESGGGHWTGIIRLVLV